MVIGTQDNPFLAGVCSYSVRQGVDVKQCQAAVLLDDTQGLRQQGREVSGTPFARAA